MSIKEMNNVIGKTGYIKEGELMFGVHVTDVKQSYGNVRYLVKPATGYGETWVNESRVDLKETL